MRCEGPYDFHTEEEVPKLLSKLALIKARGGRPKRLVLRPFPPCLPSRVTS